MERFCCVEVQNYVVMGNHFHLLLRVPEREKVMAKFLEGTAEEREARLLEHLKLLVRTQCPPPARPSVRS